MSSPAIGRPFALRRRSCAALAEAAIAAMLCGSAPAQSTRSQSILLDNPRPLAEALETLRTRHRRAITYEDPRYLYADDIKDITLEVRKDLARFPPGQAPRVLIPLGGRIDFEYDVSAATGDPEDWDALLDELLESHAAAGRGARFRVERSGDVYHVIPAQIRNTSGQWVKTASILDAYITVPEQEFTKLAAVEAVVQAVNEAMDVRLSVASCLACGIRSTLEEPVERFAVHNELARDALWRALENFRAGAGWRIYQQPGTNDYTLNPSFLPPPAISPPPLLLPSAAMMSPVRVGCAPTPAMRNPCAPRDP